MNGDSSVVIGNSNRISSGRFSSSNGTLVVLAVAVVFVAVLNCSRYTAVVVLVKVVEGAVVTNVVVVF